MAFTCGFFNSVNGDRRYNAEQMNNPYKRLVSNGIFANEDGTESTDFLVSKDTIGTVKVAKGDGIFFDKWAKLDSEMTLDMYDPDTVFPRIDSVVIRVDLSDSVRAGSLIIKKGSPATSPTAPELDDTSTVKEYRLANILMPANATSADDLTITDTRATSECGWIVALVQQPDISIIYEQWNATFSAWWEQFRAWVDDLKSVVEIPTSVKAYSQLYTTTTASETEITVTMSDYNPLSDILQVYVNGMMIAEGTDYTRDDNVITLRRGLDINTPVLFIAIKGTAGIQSDALYQGTASESGQTITPSKTLSKCFRGWQLVYATSTGDLQQSVFVPKKNASNATWSGQTYIYSLLNDSKGTMAIKSLTVHDDKIVCGTTSGNLILRVIYEY